MKHAYNPIMSLAAFGNSIEYLFHLFGQWEFLPSTYLSNWLGGMFCNIDQRMPVYKDLCGNMAFIFFGIHEAQLNT